MIEEKQNEFRHLLVLRLLSEGEEPSTCDQMAELSTCSITLSSWTSRCTQREKAGKEKEHAASIRPHSTGIARGFRSRTRLPVTTHHPLHWEQNCRGFHRKAARSFPSITTCTPQKVTFCDAPLRSPLSQRALLPVGSSSTSSLVLGGNLTCVVRAGKSQEAVEKLLTCSSEESFWPFHAHCTIDLPLQQGP